MSTTERIRSLDFLRGTALIFIIFFHTSVYNFANIHKLDFSHPPVIIVLISFLILWGGLIILYSGFVNTLMLARRSDDTSGFKPFGFLILAGGVYVVIHFLLNIIFGRWSVDFVNNQPNLTAVAATIRTGSLSFPPVAKLFEGSSLSTIAINLMIVSLVNFMLLRKGGITKEVRNYSILIISGVLIMILSFKRIDMYPYFQDAIQQGNTAWALAGSFVLANPYPLLPYLAYGLFGSAAALMVYHDRRKLFATILAPLGILFLVYGITGALKYDKTISTPDFFWYFKTHFELGIFLLMLSILLMFRRKPSMEKSRFPLILWFSRISLTIYLLETFVSEILAQAGLVLFPGWNQTINGCLVFGAVNVAVWSLILLLWRKINFRYSLEYFWVKAFSGLGKVSGKLDELP